MRSAKLAPIFVACLIVASQALRAQDDLPPGNQEKRPQVEGEKNTLPKDGVRIHGTTQIPAANRNVSAIAIGEGNTAKNTTGAIKGGVQIQGNTNIRANQKNVSAVAVGKNNTANNEAGVIGSKGDTVMAIGMGRQDQKAVGSGQIGRNE